MEKGYFITFEGPDGSGKTTVTTLVCEKLKEYGFEVVHTREPGGIDIAEQIRNVILDPNNTKMDPKTEALLYAASRRQHLIEKVIPSINDGKIVICERFVDSSLAYQGYARGLGIDEVLSINQFAIENFFPNLTIYLDIDEEEGLKRVNSRGITKDRLDSEAISFHHKVVEGYQEILKRFKERIAIVDASKPIDEVVENTIDAILKYING